MKIVLLSLLFLSIHAYADNPFTGERDYLKKLGDFEKRREDYDPLPYLIVSTAQAYSTSLEQTYAKVKELIEKGKTTYSLKSKEDLKLPEVAIKDSELEGIQKCDRSYCAIKLLDATEKKRLEESSDKLEMYKQFLFERLLAYTKVGELTGSEKVVSNLPTIKKGFSYLEFVKSKYPQTYKLISEGPLAQKKIPKGAPFLGSFMNQEVIHLNADKMKPVLRISEVFEFKEADMNLYFDLHIYSNHFFDSSFRFIEVSSHKYEGRPSKVIITDVMEVDELKKSGLIRGLFKGKMIEGIQFYEDTFLDKVK